MCVQSTIVPLSRAGKHTLCESVRCVCSGKKKHEVKSMATRMGKNVCSLLCVFFSFFKRIGVVLGCSRPYQFQAYEQLFSRSPSQVTKKREETFICWSFARLWYIGNAFYLWAAWVYHAAVKITSHFLCASCVVISWFLVLRLCDGCVLFISRLFRFSILLMLLFSAVYHFQYTTSAECVVCLFTLRISAGLAKVEHYGTTIQVENTPVGISTATFLHISIFTEFD